MAYPNLLGKVALITGASSGIGAATAVYLASCGAKVCLTGRNLSQLEKVAASCSESSHPLLVAGDLVDGKCRASLIDKLITRFGKLDVLVNCAGIAEFGTIETTSLEQYDKVFDINVRAIYHLTMLAVPYLIESKGSIVNVSSVNGMRSFLERCQQTHALGRHGQPEEVAKAIAFLASTEMSGFVTGVSLPVDGGRHAMCPR